MWKIAKLDMLYSRIWGDERISDHIEEITISHREDRANKIQAEAWRQIVTIETNGFKPKYISLNLKAYEVMTGFWSYVANCGSIQFPQKLLGLDFLVNPLQQEEVTVLVDARDEFLYTNAIRRE